MPVASPNFSEAHLALLLPLPRRTIGDDVLDTLRKSISAGAFAPGDQWAHAFEVTRDKKVVWKITPSSLKVF